MNCYECKHRRSIPGNCHSQCANGEAKVVGNPHGVMNGWFWWPINFDPTWLQNCTGFEKKEQA